MSESGNTALAYFDRMYQHPDPWGYETAWYERRKYAITTACLPRERYRRAFEPGCSIGVLTALLAERCDELVSADFHPPSVERARERVGDRSGVVVERLEVPDEWPPGTFDLIVLSEVAYYLDDQHLDRLRDHVAETLEPGGDVVLVHWRGTTDYPQSGDAVHQRWGADRRFGALAGYREREFRLDVWRRLGASAEAGER